MVKLFVLVMVFMIFVIVGGPNVLAQQNWTTFYNPDYKFSLNYPANESTTVIDINSPESLLGKQFSTPPISFAIIVKPSNIDPQEYTVAYSQNLPVHYDLLEGGKVISIVEDGVEGYLVRAINEQNGSWNYIINFGKNGYLYSFMFQSPFNDVDIEQVNSIVDSIKFFD